MSELGFPDRHQVNEATGWLGLGDPVAARAALQPIETANATHPEVLEVWWRIHAAERSWEEALRVAGLELTVDPDRVSGWIDRSYTLHELRRTREAWEALLPAVTKFPEVGLVRYNLACYASQLGDLPEARRQLQAAVARDPAGEFKTLALTDPDLRPLRENSGPR